MDDFEDRPPTPPPHQLPPYYRQRRTSASLSLFGPSDSTAEAIDTPKLSPQEPAAKSSPSPKPPTQSQLLTAQDVSSWWGSSGTIRQWRERGTPATKPVIPSEQEERWKQAKQRVSLALKSTIGYTLDVTHEALQTGGTLLRFAPVPGLDEVARVLLSIWDALQQVDTNKNACLRLTERCAEILLAVRMEIYDAGDCVGDELAVPLERLTDSFRSVHILLQKQVHRPFIKRYLKRDEITRNINGCDAELKDALMMFSFSIQVRTLKQILALERQQKTDYEKIIEALNGNVDLDRTPRPAFITLPDVDEVPPASSPQGSTSTSAQQSDINPESVISPPPSPEKATSLSVAAPNPDVLKQQLEQIVAMQNEVDHAMDMNDLRRILRGVLATASDAEIIQLLQVQREDMPEAIKTLQRAFEQCIEREQEHQNGSVNGLVEHNAQTTPSSAVTVTRTATSPSYTESSQTKPLSNLRRRLTLDSQKTKTEKVMRKLSKRIQQFEGTTLDKEFIESGIDALRRLSTGQDLTLPSWTITRYEVDLEEKIGVGFFSDVYKASWRKNTVAVKVLSSSTPRRLFLQEMAVWKKLDHPNVLPLFGASSARGDPPWFFVSPYMKYGNIVAYLRKPHKQVDGLTLKRMIHEIATGMEYLHSKGVTHGDLKGTNVLINDDEQCVISDFGQSEMKSEAYRNSGSAPARGALRWRAPEILDGLGFGRPTDSADVYAFAVVCVEVLGRGALPWSRLDDEDVRALVLEGKRPQIPGPSNSDINRIISDCWAQDPKARPSFNVIVAELGKIGVSKFVESSSLTMSRAVAWDLVDHKPSPDIKPNTPLPRAEDLIEGELEREGSQSGITTTTTTTSSYHTAPTTIIPVQRVITPIREDDKQVSPVEYRPIQMPVPQPYSPVDQSAILPPSGSLLFSPNPSEHPQQSGIPVVITDQQEQANGHPTTTTNVPNAVVVVPHRADTGTTTHSKGSSTTTDSRESEVLQRDQLGVVREFQSPIPADEQMKQMKNEKRYRLNLHHDFNQSLKLALWDPCPVELGAVGYLDKRIGRFVTLLNAFDPVTTSNGRAKGMPSLYGYGKVAKGEKNIGRNAAQRGLDKIQGLLPFVNRNGQFKQSVTRRYSFPIHAGRRSAYLCTETTRYKYIVDQRLECPKEWFKSNIKGILKLYGREHSLQKEDVFLVIGTLSTQDYALFVNHNRPDGQVHFNVFTSPKAGQEWGIFSTDLTLPPSLSGGPDYDDFHSEKDTNYWTGSKVSCVGPNRPWDAVLLARLRFKPDNDVPTSL